MSQPFVFDECLSDADYTVVAANRIRTFLSEHDHCLKYLESSIINQYLSFSDDEALAKENAFNALQVVTEHPNVVKTAIDAICSINSISEVFMNTLDFVSMFNFLYHETQCTNHNLPTTVRDYEKMTAGEFVHYYDGLTGPLETNQSEV